MPHAPEIIERVKRNVLKTYGQEAFSVLVERPLAGKDRRYQPDIQILADEKIVCVVEIGYTRPEKLQAYQKKNIPDIRWYSKDGELIQTLSPSKPLAKDPSSFFDLPSELDQWRGIYFCGSMGAEFGLQHPAVEVSLECPECFEENFKPELCLAVSPECPFGDPFGEGHQWDSICDACLDSAKDEQVLRAYEKAIEESTSELYGGIYSNGSRVFMLFQCDLCGRSFVETDHHTIFSSIYPEIYNFDDFLAAFYKQEDRNMEKTKKLTFEYLHKQILHDTGEQISYFQLGRWPSSKEF